MLTLATPYVEPHMCYVTPDGAGRCVARPALGSSDISPLLIATVHAVCLYTGNDACFLDIYGDVHCSLFQYRVNTFSNPDGELWVELVCGVSSFCARSASGKHRCFNLVPSMDASVTFKSAAPLPGDFTMLAASNMAFPSYNPNEADRQRFCGVDAARRLQCMFIVKNGLAETSRLVTFDGAWAAAAATYNSVCAISAN